VGNGIENVHPHIVSLPNGNIPLGDEHVVFLLTQTFGCEEVIVYIGT